MHHRRLLTFLALTAISCLGFSASAASPIPPLKIIYAFSNGMSPDADVVLGTNGNFYGVTATGGMSNFGGIFEVSSSNGLVTNIWLNGTDGANPLASLSPDKSGNFYGTASSGGVRSNGTIFKITSAGKFELLASFNQTNGSTPLGPLLEGTNGWYYGTTYNGGANNLGAIFCVSAAGVLSNVYSFSGSDGANPAAGLTASTNGNLYGTTEYGGANGLGTMFELTYSNTLTTVYSFSMDSGAFPGQLTAAGSNFYGTTINGGSNFAGTIFEISSNGNLHTSVALDITNGANPNSPLATNNQGVLYGTTQEGGANGMGTIFRLNAQGNVTTLFSFGGANGELPRSGIIMETNGRFYGTTSLGGSNGYGEIYELTNIPPFIIKPPASQKFASKAKASFSVVAGGSVPLSYQWFFDGMSISNATSSSYTITNEVLTNSGTYTVKVTNDFGYIFSDAVLSVPQPTAAFDSPAAGARTTNNVVTGTASAFAGVTNVNYWFTNVNAGQTVANGAASLTTNGTKTLWSISNALVLPGTNYVTVQSIDSLSNQSAFATLEFFYVSPAVFTLNAIGAGGFKGSASVAHGIPPTNGALLDIGEGYSLTAVPSNHYVFSNWTSSAGFASNAGTLQFFMESNLAITANFVTNLFIGAAGTYNGLFYQTNGVTEQTAGMLKNLTVSSNGTYSGALLLAGASYSLPGSFNLSGYASNYVNRTAVHGGSAAVEMTLDWTNGEIAGSVSNLNPGGWVSPLDAEKSAPPSPSAEYTVLLQPGTNAIGEIPPGDGYMLITNQRGNVTLSGALADGSAFSQAVPLGVLGDVPVFYGSLYSSTGLLLGWLGLSSGAVQPEGNLAWIKPGARSGIYTNGFTNELLVTGSGWTNPPPKMSAVSLMNGTLTISKASQTLVFTVSITNNTLVKAANNLTTNSLTGTVTAKTGLLTVTFGTGAGKSTTTGYGALQQNSANGGGYFLTKTNAGSITLVP